MKVDLSHCKKNDLSCSKNEISLIYEVVLREQRNAFFIVASAKRRRRRNNQSYIETKRASGMELKELSVISQSKETNTNDFASLSTSPPRSTERFAEVKGGEANNTEKRH